MKDVTMVDAPNKAAIIESPLYQKRRTVELAQNVLNARLNIFNDKKSLEDLFCVYGEALKGKVSDGCISSIQNSKDCVDFPELQKSLVSSLIPNKSDSFLIMPIGTQGHMFAGVVRRLYNKKFSLTVVNKGARAFNPMYKEFVLNEEKIHEFIHNFSKMTKSISATYEALQKSSVSSNGLPFKSSEQKIGNCFIKEPETAIKFAVFTSGEIKKLDKNKKLTPKWPVPTEEMHTLFIKELKKLRPEAAPLLAIELETYQKNKQFRELIKTGSDPMNALSLSFNNGQKLATNSPNQIKTLLKKINADTLRTNSDAVTQIVESTGDKEYINKYKKMESLSNLGNAYISMPGTVEFISGMVDLLTWKQSFRQRVTNTVKTCQEDFPQVVDSIKHDYHAGYLAQINSFGVIFHNNKTMKRLDDAIELYPENHKAHFVRGVLIYAKGDLEKGLKEMEYSLEINPNFKEGALVIAQIKKEMEKMDKDDVSTKNPNPSPNNRAMMRFEN